MARNPELTKNDIDESDNHDIEINEVSEFDIADYDLSDPKEFKKYIIRIERVCRNSYEYKAFIAFLRDFAGFNKCSIMKNVSNELDKGVKIHVHHHPLTLFDIVSTIVSKNIGNGLPTDENTIAREVMFNHYALKVGLIPLSETVHELVHNQYLFIPNNIVLGNWKAFIEEYKDYVPKEVISNIEKSDEMSRNYNFEDNTKILEHGFVNIQTNEEYQPDTETLFNKINSTLNEIKAKNDT
jgi:hypothetical protein